MPRNTPVKMGQVFVIKQSQVAKGAAEAGAMLVGGLEKANGDPTWIPMIGVHDDSEVYREGDRGELVVKEWLAVIRGWL